MHRLRHREPEPVSQGSLLLREISPLRRCRFLHLPLVGRSAGLVELQNKLVELVRLHRHIRRFRQDPQGTGRSGCRRRSISRLGRLRRDRSRRRDRRCGRLWGRSGRRCCGRLQLPGLLGIDQGKPAGLTAKIDPPPLGVLHLIDRHRAPLPGDAQRREGLVRTGADVHISGQLIDPGRVGRLRVRGLRRTEQGYQQHQHQQ